MKKWISIFSITIFPLLLSMGCSNAVAMSQLIDLPTAPTKIEITHFSCSPVEEYTIDNQEDMTEMINRISGLKLKPVTFKEGESPDDMAGGDAYAVSFYPTTTLTQPIFVDSGAAAYVTFDEEWYELKNTDLSTFFSTLSEAEKTPLNDLIPMVFIDGELYLDTGKESDLYGRCGIMDGEITSAVPPSQKPTENNQSNFGVSFQYQLIDETKLDIYLDGTWFRFEKETPSFPQTKGSADVFSQQSPLFYHTCTPFWGLQASFIRSSRPGQAGQNVLVFP